MEDCPHKWGRRKVVEMEGYYDSRVGAQTDIWSYFVCKKCNKQIRLYGRFRRPVNKVE